MAHLFTYSLWLRLRYSGDGSTQHLDTNSVRFTVRPFVEESCQLLIKFINCYFFYRAICALLIL